MPTVLGPEFGSDFSGRPAHISPRDLAIWQAWWPTVRDAVSSVWFDVGLGEGASGGGGVEPALRDMWLKNTQKRADVVMRYRGGLFIVELRSAASASAIGRLQLYLHLWNVAPAFAGRIDLWLVTDQVDSDVAALARSLSVVYTVVQVGVVPAAAAQVS